MEVSLISLFDFSFLRLFFLTKEKLIYMSCLLLGDFSVFNSKQVYVYYYTIFADLYNRSSFLF